MCNAPGGRGCGQGAPGGVVVGCVVVWRVGRSVAPFGALGGGAVGIVRGALVHKLLVHLEL